MVQIHTKKIDALLKAFLKLRKTDREVFFERLLATKTYREDLLDVATLEARRHEPARPLRSYIRERSRRSH